MEKVTEITTKDKTLNAFDVLMRCKEFATQIDISNIILDNTCIDEKEMLINVIESLRDLELEIIEIQPNFTIEAEA
tara:strand:+ start:2916 stop:3143 length:228 start_codon:yes stop_codon:yes gene_type:complete